MLSLIMFFVRGLWMFGQDFICVTEFTHIDCWELHISCEEILIYAKFRDLMRWKTFTYKAICYLILIKKKPKLCIQNWIGEVVKINKSWVQSGELTNQFMEILMLGSSIVTEEESSLTIFFNGGVKKSNSPIMLKILKINFCVWISDHFDPNVLKIYNNPGWYTSWQ